MTTEELKQLEDQFQLDTYAKLPLSIERGEGCYVYDSEGTKYLDYYGGHCVASTGHCHPKVVAAIRDQVGKLIFYSNATYSAIRGLAVQKLISLSRPTYAKAFLVNSGAEANDNAIKLARNLTGRKEVISTERAFHGRTYGALSATGIENYRNYLNPAVPNHTIVPVEKVSDSISKNTAGVLLEPIQSMGGVVVHPLETLQTIAAACARNGALLLFDEIQTGVGRTGSFLYSQKLGLEPHITSLAKGIASGYAAGAVLLGEELSSQVKRGDLGSTFGGSPLACAAMASTMDVIREEGILENVRKVGSELRHRLQSLSQVKEVRGEGLLLGISLHDRTAKEVQQGLLKQKILAGTSFDPEILRLMPPLTLGPAEVDQLVEAIEKL